MRTIVIFFSTLALVGMWCLILPGCNSSSQPKVSGNLSSGDVAKNQELARSKTDQAFQRIEKSDYDGAADLLKEATAADPLYGPAHNDLGLVYYHGDDLYNAAWEFENATKLMPRQAPPLNNLGLVMEKGDKLPDAEKSFASASELDPLNTEYAGNYARVRIKLNERDELTRKLLELIVLKDRRPEWVDWAREQESRIEKQNPQQAK